MQPNRHKPSIVRPLILWICGGLVLISLGMWFLQYWLALRPLEHQLAERAISLGSRFASAFAESVWNLEDDGIRDYFLRYAPSDDLSRVVVYSEFDDVIYARSISPSADAVVSRQPVIRNGAVIGSVEVALSRASLKAARRTILGASQLSVLAGIVMVVLFVVAVMRVGLERPVGRLLGEIRAIAHGDYARVLPEAQHAEIDALYREVEAMTAQIARVTGELRDEVDRRTQAQAQLQRLAGELEGLVAARTRELTQANVRMQLEIAERKKAQAEILSAGMTERQRVGRDLHDGIGQQMVGIQYLCQALLLQLKDGRSAHAGAAEALLAQIQIAVEQTRRMAHGLMPGEIAELGLRAGLENLAVRARKLFGIECCLEEFGEQEVGDPDIAAHLYYAAQEAINNAVRHGHATQVILRLRVNAYRGYLAIEDNGKGLSSRAGDDAGAGFRTMRFRAEACDGWFKILDSQPAGITVVLGFKNLKAAQKK